MQNAPSPIEPESVFAGLRWTPILLGGALDNFLSMLVVLPLTFVFAGTDALSGDEEKSAQAIDQVIASPEFLAKAVNRLTSCHHLTPEHRRYSIQQLGSAVL